MDSSLAFRAAVAVLTAACVAQALYTRLGPLRRGDDAAQQHPPWAYLTVHTLLYSTAFHAWWALVVGRRAFLDTRRLVYRASAANGALDIEPSSTAAAVHAHVSPLVHGLALFLALTFYALEARLSARCRLHLALTV